MKVRSVKGHLVDMAALLAMNEDAIALGNGMMNARGDRINRNGVVVKSREDVAAEYHRSNPKAVKHVSIKDMSAEMFQNPADAVKTLVAKPEPKAETKMAEKKPSRKIVDTEE